MYFQNGMCVKSDSYMLDAETSEGTVRWAKTGVHVCGSQTGSCMYKLCLASKNQNKMPPPRPETISPGGHI